MDSMFPYSDSARRKAKKEKALEEGKLSSFDPALPEAAAHPQDPMDFRVLPTKQARKAPAPRKGGAPARAGAAVARNVPPGVRASAAARPVLPGARAAPPGARPARPVAPKKVGGRPAGRRAGQGVHVNAERLLLESRALDLFGTGKTGHVVICPDCRHEIVKIVCLGTPVRACLECKGVWISYPVARDFARENEWFLQLGPAIQLEIDKRKRTR